MVEPDPIRLAIVERLESDTAIQAAAPNGVWWRSAEQGTDPPIVIVSKMSGIRRWSFGGPPMRNQTWLVKGVGDAEDAEYLDALCLAALTDAPLVIGGVELLLAPLPEDEVSYEDDQYGESYQHEGSYYRVITERASS